MVFLEVGTKVQTKIFGWMLLAKVQTKFGQGLGRKVQTNF